MNEVKNFRLIELPPYRTFVDKLTPWEFTFIIAYHGVSRCSLTDRPALLSAGYSLEPMSLSGIANKFGYREADVNYVFERGYSVLLDTFQRRGFSENILRLLKQNRFKFNLLLYLDFDLAFSYAFKLYTLYGQDVVIQEKSYPKEFYLYGCPKYSMYDSLLTARETEVFLLYYGYNILPIEDREYAKEKGVFEYGCTYSQIADIFGVTNERVKCVFASASRKITSRVKRDFWLDKANKVENYFKRQRKSDDVYKEYRSTCANIIQFETLSYDSFKKICAIAQKEKSYLTEVYASWLWKEVLNTPIDNLGISQKFLTPLKRQKKLTLKDLMDHIDFDRINRPFVETQFGNYILSLKQIGKMGVQEILPKVLDYINSEIIKLKIWFSTIAITIVKYKYAMRCNMM